MAIAQQFETHDLEPEQNSREPLTMVRPLPSAPVLNFSQTPGADTRAADLTEKAYRALHIGFVALPLVAGVDKFANVLCDWGEYLAPSIPGALGVSTPSFMLGVGAFEIFLGLGLAMKPRLFADLFSAYLVAIIGNLMLHGQFYDVALFDFALAAGACALARLSYAKEAGAFGSAEDDLGRPASGRRAA